MDGRLGRVGRARPQRADLLQQVDDRAHAVGGRRRRGGHHPDDAGASAYPAHHQLPGARSHDSARRGAQRRAGRLDPQCHLELVRLRRPERVAGDGAGALLMAPVQGARRVLVTGGGRGLGAAIVKALAAAGHDVTFTYRSSGDAEAAAKALAAAYPGQRFAALRVDLSDRDAVAAFAALLGQEDSDLARYDGFVHNAGHTYDALAMMMDQAKAEVAMQVNYWAFTRLANALVRPMMRARHGRVAVIGSVTALQANQGNAAYAASKAALLAYARTLAIETARTGVTVNYLAPGFIDTAMMEPYAKYREQMEAQIPARRFARAQEIADTVTFLLSPQASYITGSVLTVDGGLSAAIGVHR